MSVMTPRPRAPCCTGPAILATTLEGRVRARKRKHRSFFAVFLSVLSAEARYFTRGIDERTPLSPL